MRRVSDGQLNWLLVNWPLVNWLLVNWPLVNWLLFNWTLLRAVCVRFINVSLLERNRKQVPQIKDSDNRLPNNKTD